MSRTTFQVALLTLATATILLGASTVEGHYYKTLWSYGDQECRPTGGLSDPITVVFFGSGAHYSGSRRDALKHTRWAFGGGPESRQYFKDHSLCEPQHGELADADGVCCNSRYHIRFYGQQHRDNRGRWITFGTPHFEDFITRPAHPKKPFCHAVGRGQVDRPDEPGYREESGFDKGRRRVTRALNRLRSGRENPHHDVSPKQWGNTYSIKQCDDDYAGSNGVVNWISIGDH